MLSTKKGRVLIVEDESDLAWLEQFNLETEGYSVQVALEGRSGLDAITSFDPDVLVLDVMLPQLDGWSVLSQMEELPEDRRPVVILVSALSGPEEQAKARQMGVSAFLPKPFEMDDLIGMVGEALDQG